MRKEVYLQMKIAVLSGKGGTGKTTVAASLSMIKENIRYADCDVEEPNGYIFLKPELTECIAVDVLVPVINEDICDGCGLCAKVCQFNALAVVKKKVIVFNELCHHCGACKIVCPVNAISEVNRNIGVVNTNKDHTFVEGRLNTNEPVTVPVIGKIMEVIDDDTDTIIDCPPGASCSVVAAIEKCSYLIIVTEPTPFGFHDLKIAVALARKMNKPFGIVINKAGKDNSQLYSYCSEENIKILLEIPFSRDIAGAYSKGILPILVNDSIRELFLNLYASLIKEVEG